MATLFRKNDRGREIWMIQVVVPGLGRKTVRLGDVAERSAQRFREKVEELAGCRRLNVPPDSDLTKWLAGVSADLHRDLVTIGLAGERDAPAPSAPTILAFFEKYIAQKRSEISPRSIELLEQTRDRLVDALDAATPLNRVTTDHAADWRASMVGEGLSEATVRLHTRNAKSFFNAAIDRELIVRNPFRALPTGAVAANRDFYLTVADAEKVLEQLPDHHWRALFGLARFGGLRVSSESHTLTWAGVDLAGRRMTVYAPKTGATRVVPIVPRLHQILSESHARRDEDVERVVPLSANNIHRTVANAATRAELKAWPDTFQALRRAAATDFAAIAPPHAVAAWMGHGINVSAKHYLQVTPDLFDRAASPRGTKLKIAG